MEKCSHCGREFKASTEPVTVGGWYFNGDGDGVLVAWRRDPHLPQIVRAACRDCVGAHE